MRKDKAGSGTAIDTLIGSGTTITGDINFTGGLHLEGAIVGNIAGNDGSARLDVSEQGRVAGEIHVATAIVSGSVEGDLHAGERLVLGQRARIDGNVFYHVLEMAAGAQVNGKLVYRPGNAEPLALEHRAANDRA
ncbi:MAG TPA: polymer-forming cytoskeletal protein [Gammaproteobacteria bacterium]|nr:polymer-forming cytoskeletal protein [Gammaproteobacteria bacterium]